ncbi:MAG: alpha/beta fold hydrolase [Desulfobacterales bacterium]|jgi:pimeloyl-ACP methyl ester carboxylesterase
MPATAPKVEYAQLADLRVAYERFGRREDPAILLAIGLGTQMVAWDEAFCRWLADRRLYVIRYDNRDVGLSTHWHQGGRPDIDALARAQAWGQALAVPYTLVDMARDTLGLLDHLGLARAHFVGLSMGAMIGQEMAVHWPDRLRTLISIMSTTGCPSLPPPTPAALDILMKPFPGDREGYIEAFVAAFHTLSGPIHPTNDGLTRRWAAEHYDRGLNPDGITRQMAAIMASGDRTARLKQVAVPTLVLHGSADPLLPLEHGRATARAIPGARLEVIEGMGHAIPESLWETIIDRICGHIA